MFRQTCMKLVLNSFSMERNRGDTAQWCYFQYNKVNEGGGCQASKTTY